MTKRTFFFLAVSSIGPLACSSASPPPPQTAAVASAPLASAAASTPTTATPAATVPAVPLPAPVGAATCENPRLEDLEDGDGKTEAVDERGGNWFTYKDDAGSTVSPEGIFAPTPGGANGSKSAAHITGKTATAKVAYAGMGFSLADPMGPYDLSKAKGFCFSAKGKGWARVKLPDVNTFPEGGVCKSCFNDFGADFALTDDWKEHCFEFGKLRQQWGWGEPKPAPAVERVYSVQWQVAVPGVDYDVWVDDVRLECD